MEVDPVGDGATKRVQSLADRIQSLDLKPNAHEVEGCSHLQDDASGSRLRDKKVPVQPV